MPDLHTLYLKKMKFELLPNEIILDLFEYLSFIHLFHGFIDLNSRFKQLLCEQFQKFHADFRLISKTNFDRICHTHLPLAINRMISLHLSNDDDTPQQIERFLSYENYQLRQFIHLQSLSISYIQSKQTLIRIIMECSYLPCLTRLILSDGHLLLTKSDAQDLYNHIWNLPKLSYCYLDINFVKEKYFPNPTVVSTSLRQLIILCVFCTLSQLNHLCQHTPFLQHLSMKFQDDSDRSYVFFPILSITRLEIFSGESTIESLHRLIKIIPSVTHLSVESYDIYISGNQWEEIIKTYLPKLKTFHFETCVESTNDENKEDRLNEIMDSYRTNFWTNEHQWFVRTHWHSEDIPYKFECIHIFTVPSMFHNFSTSPRCILKKSNYPQDDDEYLTCTRVLDFHCETLHFTDSIQSRLRFPNIKSLSLVLPFDEQIFFTITTMRRVTSLYVYIRKNEDLVDNIQSKLQLLLDQAPCLHSLRIGSMSPCTWQVPPMGITNVSILRLDLETYIYDNDGQCFDKDKCIQLSNSLLGKQCETLRIKVKNRQNILYLMNTMHNLQALTVQCLDDSLPETNNSMSPIVDEFLEWLDHQLPSTCIVTRDTYSVNKIRIWIC